jgi:hypothetical protein
MPKQEQWGGLRARNVPVVARREAHACPTRQRGLFSNDIGRDKALSLLDRRNTQLPGAKNDFGKSCDEDTGLSEIESASA